MKINLLNNMPKSNYNLRDYSSRLIVQRQRKILSDSEIAKIPTAQLWPEIKSLAEDFFMWLSR